MGKKTVKKSEKKPRHKWRLNIHKTVASKKEQEKTWREIRQEKLERLLQLGLDRNDESVLRLKKEIKDIARQRALARKLVKVPINLSLVPPDLKKETDYLVQKMIYSARENVPEAVLSLIMDRLMDKFGRSYKRFVYHLMAHMWLKVHLRCLQEDAGLGLSDEVMAEMQPLHLLKLLDGVAVASVERKMKVLVSEFGLDTPCSYPVQDIITELVEKMVKAFAKVAPHDAKAVFAKVAHDDSMARAMDLAIRGISLAK